MTRLHNAPARDHYDVVIVGARCAGASTAILLARAGARVLVVDKGSYGKDTLSTHALMRPAVLQLARWGLLDGIKRSGAPALTRTAFHYGSEAIEVDIKPRGAVDALYSPRRTVLDALLVDAAREAGAEVCYRVRLEGLLFAADGAVRGVALHTPAGRREIRAGVVIGADGARSLTARLLDAAPAGARSARGTIAERSGEHASFVIYSYFGGLPRDANVWYYRATAGAGFTPTNDGGACVFVATSRRWIGDDNAALTPMLFRKLLREAAPSLVPLLSERQRIAPYYRFGGLPGHMRRCAGPGWALVGDAGFFRDPITAHGISDALLDAELAARAIVRGADDAAWAEYRAARDKHALPMFRATEMVASYSWTLAELKRTHMAMSQIIKAESADLEALDGDLGQYRVAA